MWRQSEPVRILYAVRGYLRYSLSLRDAALRLNACAARRWRIGRIHSPGSLTPTRRPSTALRFQECSWKESCDAVAATGLSNT